MSAVLRALCCERWRLTPSADVSDRVRARSERPAERWRRRHAHAGAGCSDADTHTRIKYKFVGNMRRRLSLELRSSQLTA